MKSKTLAKAFAVLLALALALCMTACGDTGSDSGEQSADATYTAIPLGGNLGEFELEGAAFGEYKVVDFPEGIVLNEGSEGTCYYCEGGDTPYIVVYRWANEDGKTLEEITAEESKTYSDGIYTMTTWSDMNIDELGMYCYGREISDGNYGYLECDIMLDGDDIVEIDFISTAEEVQLGETGQYLWIPTGYKDLMDEDEVAHGTIFYGEYDESFELPEIWLSEYEGTYEKLAWGYEWLYPEGLPFDKSKFDEWVKLYKEDKWTEDVNREYYEALGYTEVLDPYVGEANGNRYYATVCKKDDYVNFEAFLYIGDEVYIADISQSADMAQTWGMDIITSLHSK